MTFSIAAQWTPTCYQSILTKKPGDCNSHSVLCRAFRVAGDICVGGALMAIELNVLQQQNAGCVLVTARNNTHIMCAIFLDCAKNVGLQIGMTPTLVLNGM